MLLAAGQGDLSVVMWLCEQNVDVHRVNYSGENALMLAAAAGHLPVVRWLYESKGLAIALVNKDGHNLLELAAWNSHLHVVQWLEDKPITLRIESAWMAILEATEIRNMAMLKWLRQRQYPLVYEDDSAFLCAVSSNDLRTAKWCHAQDASTPFLVDGVRDSCFIKACGNGNLPMLQWLCQQFGGVGVADTIPGAGQSILSAAVSSGCLHIVRWLVSQGLDPLVRQPNDSLEPIIIAVNVRCLRIVKWLYNLSVNLNRPVASNLLREAIFCGDLSIVEWLCQQGRALPEVNLDGQDALSLAIRGNHIKMSRWMFRRGCTLGAEHIDVAMMSQRREVISVLYRALSLVGRAALVRTLNTEQKRWLAGALQIKFQGSPSAKMIGEALECFDAAGGVNALRQQSLQAVVRVLRNRYPTLAEAFCGVSCLPLPETLKNDLQGLLEAQLR